MKDTSNNDKEFLLYEDALEKELQKRSENKVAIGGYLKLLKEKYQAVKSIESEFYPYVEEKFGLGKTMVKNYIKVAERFGVYEQKDGLQVLTIGEKYKEFGVTKLSLLEKLDDAEDLESLGITPDLSVKKIKEIVENHTKKSHRKHQAKEEVDDASESTMRELDCDVETVEKVNQVTMNDDEAKAADHVSSQKVFTGEDIDELVQRVKKSGVSNHIQHGRKIEYTITYKISDPV